MRELVILRYYSKMMNGWIGKLHLLTKINCHLSEKKNGCQKMFPKAMKRFPKYIFRSLCYTSESKSSETQKIYLVGDSFEINILIFVLLWWMAMTMKLQDLTMTVKLQDCIKTPAQNSWIEIVIFEEYFYFCARQSARMKNFNQFRAYIIICYESSWLITLLYQRLSENSYHVKLFFCETWKKLLSHTFYLSGNILKFSSQHSFIWMIFVVGGL